jgi:hypothetical protein
VRLEKRPAVIVLELQRKQSVFDRGTIGCPQSSLRGVVAAVKKDREPSEKGPEGSLALSRCAGTEERRGGVSLFQLEDFSVPIIFGSSVIDKILSLCLCSKTSGIPSTVITMYLGKALRDCCAVIG